MTYRTPKTAKQQKKTAFSKINIQLPNRIKQDRCFFSSFGGDKQEVDFEKTGKTQIQMFQTEPISEASFWHCCKQVVQVGSAKWAVAKKPRGLLGTGSGPGELEPQVVGPEGSEEGCECQVNKA